MAVPVRESNDDLVRTCLLSSQRALSDLSPVTREQEMFLKTVTLANYSEVQTDLLKNIKKLNRVTPQTARLKLEIAILVQKNLLIQNHFFEQLFSNVTLPITPLPLMFKYNDADIDLDKMAYPILKSEPSSHDLSVYFLAVKINQIPQVLKLYVTDKQVELEFNAFMPAHLRNEIFLTPLLSKRTLDAKAFTLVHNLLKHQSLHLKHSGARFPEDLTDSYIPFTIQLIDPKTKEPLKDTLHTVVVE